MKVARSHNLGEEREVDLAGLEELLDGVIEVHLNRVHIRWPNDEYVVIDVEGDNIKFHYIKGNLVKHLSSKMPKFFRERGIKTFEGFPSDNNDDLWIGIGFEWMPDGRFIASIEEGCRMDEYAAWKDGKIDEPDWHKEVRSDGHN